MDVKFVTHKHTHTRNNAVIIFRFAEKLDYKLSIFARKFDYKTSIFAEMLDYKLLIFAEKLDLK